MEFRLTGTFDLAAARRLCDVLIGEDIGLDGDSHAALDDR
jgi:hypothetical protein